MDFSAWEPIYEKILDDFKYSRHDDELSANILERIVGNEKILDLELLHSFFNKEVTIFGNGPSLQEQIKEVELKGKLISAGSAITVLIKNHIVPDMIVSDLDGDPRNELMANSLGSIEVIHAHGDNIPAIQEYGPQFQGKVIMTTQSRPHGVLKNFGGFTDGDRAVFMAREFNVKKINLVGFDFAKPTIINNKDNYIKLKKLKWAKKLIFEMNCNDCEIYLY